MVEPLLSLKPGQFQRVDQIRLLGSTGAVLPATVWQWIASEFGNRPVLSFSGGTEVCGSCKCGTALRDIALAYHSST
jgi:acyl-coenzyme A synthetase/AMP-(fatty) acid ligase